MWYRSVHAYAPPADTPPAISAPMKPRLKPGDPHPLNPALAPAEPGVLQALRARGIVRLPASCWDLKIDESPELRVTYTDADGRRQYRYTQEHWDRADEHKFGALQHFRQQMPGVRQKVDADLSETSGPDPKRSAAAIVRLIDQTAMRVGGEESAKGAEHYGAASLLKQHVTWLPDGRAKLSFVGKSGKSQEMVVDDATLNQVMREFHALPGEQLFQHKDRTGRLVGTTASHVGQYLAPFGVTPKQFRTYHANRLVADHLMKQPRHEDPKQREAEAVRALQYAAAHLGHDYNMTRTSYCNPALLNAYREGHLQDYVQQNVALPQQQNVGLPAQVPAEATGASVEAPSEAPVTQEALASSQGRSLRVAAKNDPSEKNLERILDRVADLLKRGIIQDA